jgi:hypothetical protein
MAPSEGPARYTVKMIRLRRRDSAAVVDSRQRFRIGNNGQRARRRSRAATGKGCPLVTGMTAVQNDRQLAELGLKVKK